MSIFNAIQKLFTKSFASDKSLTELYKEEKDVMRLLHSLPENERQFIVERVMKNYPVDKISIKHFLTKLLKFLKKIKS